MTCSLTTYWFVLYCSSTGERKTFPCLKRLLHVARDCTCYMSTMQFLTFDTYVIALARTTKRRIDESCFLSICCLTVRILSPQFMNEGDFTLYLLESSTVLPTHLHINCVHLHAFNNLLRSLDSQITVTFITTLMIHREQQLINWLFIDLLLLLVRSIQSKS